MVRSDNLQQIPAFAQPPNEKDELRGGVPPLQAGARRDVTAKPRPEVGGHHPDAADDAPVELVQLLGGHPEFLVLASADDAALEAGDVRLLHLEPRNVAGEGAALRVPIAGYLLGIAEVEHRVEDRLLG